MQDECHKYKLSVPVHQYVRVTVDVPWILSLCRTCTDGCALSRFTCARTGTHGSFSGEDADARTEVQDAAGSSQRSNKVAPDGRLLK
jgi:hypothetical protein